jgi:hypothetical protein
MKVIFEGGSAAEVTRKCADWEAANPSLRVTRRGAPGSVGDKLKVDENTNWAMTVEYEGPQSN